jgi:uncharacterized protein (TIGR02266 family)
VSLRDARRRYRRMTVRLQAVYEHAGTAHEAVATTLGAGGLFVATDAPLVQGSQLRIRFCVPGGSRLHSLDARVVWAHRPGDPGQQGHGMGLAFTNPAACAALALELAALPLTASSAERSE